jgi:hypothetical protein
MNLGLPFPQSSAAVPMLPDADHLITMFTAYDEIVCRKNA